MSHYERHRFHRHMPPLYMYITTPAITLKKTMRLSMTTCIFIYVSAFEFIRRHRLMCTFAHIQKTIVTYPIDRCLVFHCICLFKGFKVDIARASTYIHAVWTFCCAVAQAHHCFCAGRTGHDCTLLCMSWGTNGGVPNRGLIIMSALRLGVGPKGYDKQGSISATVGLWSDGG